MAQQSSLKEKFNRFLAGEYQVLQNRSMTRALPPAIIYLLEVEQSRVAERLIERMVDGLANSETSVRQMCSSCLAETAALLAENQMWRLLDKLLPTLQAIQQGVPGDGVPEDVRETAAGAVAAAANRHKVKKPEPPEKTGRKKDAVAIQEEQIFQLHRAGNSDEAKRQLFDLIVACARKKDFKNSERLRERIYEIDPMALMEIIHSGEIIEEEKSGSIDQDLLKTWSSLLLVLTQEEFNTFYHFMEKREIKAEETLVSQGTVNDEMFFINRGSLRISYFQTGKGGVSEIFLENLGSGEIASENFFNATVWTVTLTAVQRTQVSVLNREDLALLEEKNPGIESKIRDYNARSLNIASLLNRKGIDRRIHERFKMKRAIHLEIIGNTGKVLSSFKGVLADISQGGLSFVVRINKKETSRLLLGRNIRATIPFTHGGEEKVEGTVIGVNSRDRIHGDFSVHVKFSSELERQTQKLIIE